MTPDKLPLLDIVVVGPFPEDESFIRGGVQASVYGLSMTLARRNDVRSVTVMSTPIDRRAESKRITGARFTVVHLDVPWRFMSSSVLHLRRIVREASALQNPVFHIHGTGLLSAALCLTLSLKRLPYVFTLHGLAEKETWDQLCRHRSLRNFVHYAYFRFLERLLLRIAPRVIVDTAYVAQAVRRKRGVHVVPQGIFADELSKARSPGPRRDMIMSVGAFSPRKGHDRLLEAFKRVRARHSMTELVIVGAIQDQEYFEKLTKRVADFEFSDAVSLHPDAAREKIVALLNQANLFALHSQEESQGIALCEALAAGLPIVATDVGGIPYVVTHGKDGILVSFGDTVAFSDALSALLTDESRRAEMSAEARRNCIRFDWNNIVDAIVALYRDL